MWHCTQLRSRHLGFLTETTCIIRITLYLCTLVTTPEPHAHNFLNNVIRAVVAGTALGPLDSNSMVSQGVHN